MTEKYTQSKEYLVPLSLKAASISATPHFHASKTPAEQNISLFLFDAGATYPSKKAENDNDWSGTGWIFDWYANRGLKFDHIYAWEPRAMQVDENDLDPLLASALHFFTVGITDQVDSEHNPLVRIKNLCTQKDIVVFKLDIDCDVELSVARQLLENPELSGIVDEFFFEHHVKNNLMRMHGLGGNDPSRNLKTWYDMVIPARKKGLHMHFWP
jgi:hypothetical protein